MGDASLAGIMYEAWGLYNDGVPACRFESTGESDAIQFVGTCRTRGGTFVERRCTVRMDDIAALVYEATPPPMID